MIAGAAGTGYGAYIAALGMIGGTGGTVFGGGAAALAIGSVAVGVGALIAVGGIHVSAQASANLKKDLDEYWKSRLNESRASNGTESEPNSLYDGNGNYTGGRSQAELDELVNDPAHSGSTRQADIDKGLHEREVGLGLEESGKVKGPITRDPSGKAEFIDANGQAWDVKSFNSNYKPSKGGYTLTDAMNKIYDSLAENENVMLDTSNFNPSDTAELMKEIIEKGLEDKVIVWP